MLLLCPYCFCPLLCPSLHETFPWYLWFSSRDLKSFPFCCFPLFVCIVHWGEFSYLSLLFFGTLHSDNFPNQLPLDTDGGKDFMKRWVYLIRSISGLVNRIVKSLSRVRIFVTLWTVAYQASPSMGFSRQEYWSGLPFPSPGDFPDPGIEPRSPALEADALTSEPPGKPTSSIGFSNGECSFYQTHHG